MKEKKVELSEQEKEKLYQRALEVKKQQEAAQARLQPVQEKFEECLKYAEEAGFAFRINQLLLDGVIMKFDPQAIKKQEFIFVPIK